MGNADHPTCDDPACDICADRERDAVQHVKRALRSPSMARLRDHAKRRGKRAHA